MASYVSNSALRPHSLTAGAIWDRPSHYRIGAWSGLSSKGPDYAINGMLVWGVRLGEEIEIGRKPLEKRGF